MEEIGRDANVKIHFKTITTNLGEGKIEQTTDIYNRGVFMTRVSTGVLATKDEGIRLALTQLGWTPPAENSDDKHIEAFAAALKAKMALGREQGKKNWDNPKLCSTGYLRKLLLNSVFKGDPVDVGNYAMMLHSRGTTTIYINQEMEAANG